MQLVSKIDINRKYSIYPNRDHFVDINEMIYHGGSGSFAGRPGLAMT